MLNTQARDAADGGVALASRNYTPDGKFGDVIIIRALDDGRALVSMRSPGEATSTREHVIRSFATLDEAIAYVVEQVRSRGGHFGPDDPNGAMCLALHGPLRMAQAQMLRRLVEGRVAMGERVRFRHVTKLTDLPYGEEVLGREGPVDVKALKRAFSLYRRKERQHD